MKYHERSAILALDQGTHASRAALFNSRGEVLFAHQSEVKLYRRSQYAVEQDANEILRSVGEVIQTARTYADTHGLLIRYAGLATQRSTVVAWDRAMGHPLYSALSWQDTRGRAFVDRLSVSHEEVQLRTGLQLSAHYGASKLRWLLENVPDVVQAAHSQRLAIGPLSSFLLFHLLEHQPFIVDHGKAGRTLLWDITTRRWDPNLLQDFAINPDWLPQSWPIRAEFGRLLGTDILLSAVNGDQAAALYGHGPPSPETAIINIGTGAFVTINTNYRPVYHRRLLAGITDSDHHRCEYSLEGTVNGAGAALQWAQNAWSINRSIPCRGLDEIDPPIFINTVGSLGSPWWQDGGAPRLIGLSPEDCRHQPARCIAAVIESIVFLLLVNIEQILNVKLEIKKLIVGGGLSHCDMLCQGLADLSGLSVFRSNNAEITARGIAWLAANRPENYSPVPITNFEPRHNPKLEKRYRKAITLLTSLGIDS